MDAIATPAAVEDFLKRWKGNTIYTYSKFTRIGGNYVAFIHALKTIWETINTDGHSESSYAY